MSTAHDVEDMVLTLRVDSDIEGLNLSIQDCSSVETVEVSCPVEQPQWASEDVYRLFSRIGAFPKLKRIQLKFLGGGDHDNMVPLSLLTTILNQSTTIEFFELILVGPISCQDADVFHFCAAIQKQVDLREFRLSSCYFSHDWLASPFSSLDPILMTLSELPCLESVKMKAANNGHLGRIYSESFGGLCQSGGFRTLCLDNFALGNPHLKALTQAMTTQTTTLQDLYLNLSAETNLDPALLSPGLAVDQSLRRIQLRLAKQKSLGEFLTNTALALQQNVTLKEFSAFGGFKVEPAVEDAFAEMLEHNCTLETVKMPSSHSGNGKCKIDMLLQFNANGRQRLLAKAETIGLQEWIGHFSRNSNDLSFVYYYVHHIGPLLCKRALGT